MLLFNYIFERDRFFQLIFDNRTKIFKIWIGVTLSHTTYLFSLKEGNDERRSSNDELSLQYDKYINE